MYSLYIQYLNNNKINTRKVADWISKSNYNIIYKSITDGKPLNWNDINPQSENISEKKVVILKTVPDIITLYSGILLIN